MSEELKACPTCGHIERRTFPIQHGPAIPWAMIEQFEWRVKENHDQSLERLAQRGGLGPEEAVLALRDMPLFGDASTAIVKRGHRANNAELLALTEAWNRRAAASLPDTPPINWQPKFALGQTVYPISEATTSLPHVQRGQWACFQPTGAPVNEIRLRPTGFSYGLWDAHPNKKEGELFATFEEATTAARSRNEHQN